MNFNYSLSLMLAFLRFCQIVFLNKTNIYIYKIQFKLTARESKKITVWPCFSALFNVYVKQWNEAPRRIRAHLNGIKFLSVLKTYPNQAVASKAHAAFSRHLWFLSEHLVVIAIGGDLV